MTQKKKNTVNIKKNSMQDMTNINNRNNSQS